jgi:hypothetical protein
MNWVVTILTFGYGLFYVIWPKTARRQFLSHFDVDAPTKWYKPNTYLSFRPPAFAFRIFGFFLIALAIFSIYIKNSQYGVK